MGMPPGTVTRNRQGRIAGVNGLTDKQADFVQIYLSNGMDQTAAASEAGYENPRIDGWRLLKNKHIRAAIDANAGNDLRRARRLSLDLIVRDLADVDDTGTPCGFFAKNLSECRKLLATICANLPPETPVDKAAGDMDGLSIDDLQALVIEAERQAGDKAQVVNAAPVEPSATVPGK